MRIRMWQIDAFAGAVFSGNPAAVCPLERWLPDATMQAIAAENNLSETAFFVPRGAADGYHLRWFTPVAEVDLCGHATLASGLVVLDTLEPALAAATFHTKSGPLTVRRQGDLLAMDLPARPPRRREPPSGLAEALGAVPREVWEARDLMAVFAAEDDVRRLAPSIDRVAAFDTFGVVVTAPGDDVDFVSRFFVPRQGIAEDPVTGSTHCTLAPYWAGRLGRARLRARQLSARGGEMECEVRGDRVTLAGRAVVYLEGVITV